MSFRQVYYTSCEEGLGSGKGFQVKAASQGIEPTTLQRVERLGLYVPPLSSPSRPSPEEIDQFPISLIFQTLDDGSAIIGQARYIGTDYTGRYGNFFTHSLISLTPYIDFCQTSQPRPIETWGSRTWVAAEGNLTVLPDIENVSFGEGIDVAEVQTFLKNPIRREIFPGFLTAVVEAIETNRRLIIVDENENVALWIAAASYSLPFHLLMKLTFNTYVRDPYQTESLIVGTTEDSTFNFAPHEIQHQFFVFDIKGSRFTPIESPSGFASKVDFIYQQDNSEPIEGFAIFVEQIAPDMPTDELETALSAYYYLEDLALPGANDVQVLAWCSKYLEKLAEKDFGNLFNRVTSKTPIEAETLGACTMFYLATLNSSITEVARQIEDLYFQWLFSKVGRNAEVTLLAETVEKLPLRFYKGNHEETIFGDWLKTLKDADNSARFAVALRLGDKVGFAAKENDVLHWLGKNIVGKWLEDTGIQQSVREISKQSGGKILLEGIAEYLVEHIENIVLFESLSTLILNEDSFEVLSNYAVENENLPLFLRLSGSKANLFSGQSDRVNVLISQLTIIPKLFKTNISVEIVQAAFNSIWLKQPPTLNEAIQLLSPPLVEYVQMSEIPIILVDSLSLGNKDEFSDPRQVDLVDKLRARPIFESLGPKGIQVDAYLIATNLTHEFTDIDGTLTKEYLQWLAQNETYVPQLSQRLYRLLGQKAVKVKSVKLHAQLISEYLKKGNGSFLSGYDSEVKRVLQTKKNHPEIARLIRTWTFAASINKSLPISLLLDWTDVLLKTLSKRELENIEDALDLETLKDWLSLKEQIKGRQKSLWGRMFGSGERKK